MYGYKVIIDRVVDGDTVDVKIELGFEVSINQRVQLEGIDTPEVNTRDSREKKFGNLARARVRELLPQYSTQAMRTIFHGNRDKYGRTLVDFDLSDGRTLTEVLILERLAVVYEGQSKADIRAEHKANWDHLEQENTD